MKLTVVGDPHITHKSLDRFQQLTEVVEAIGNSVIWMGDLLDNKEVIRGKCLNAWFDYLKSSPLNHTIIVGNHDWFNLECLDHSLRTLTELPNVIVVDRRMTLHGCWFLPYIHDRSVLVNELSKIPEGSVLFGHMDVSEFDYGNGQLCENGLLLQDLKKFHSVISGHFHKYQSKDNLTYIGTPFSHSFGESDQVKFIGVFDTETKVLTRQVTGMPRHVTLKLDLNDDPSLMDLDGFFLANEGNYIRGLLCGPQAKITSFPRYIYEKFNVRWIPKPDDVGLTNVSLEEGLDNTQQFLTWASQIRNLDPETTALGLTILEAMHAK